MEQATHLEWNDLIEVIACYAGADWWLGFEQARPLDQHVLQLARLE
jgi:hypothetical protein